MFFFSRIFLLENNSFLSAVFPGRASEAGPGISLRACAVRVRDDTGHGGSGVSDGPFRSKHRGRVYIHKMKAAIIDDNIL